VLLTAGPLALLRYLQKVEGEVCPDHTTIRDYTGCDSSCIDGIAIRHIKHAMFRSEGEMSNFLLFQAIIFCCIVHANCRCL
jgi:hypothetical protein